MTFANKCMQPFCSMLLGHDAVVGGMCDVMTQYHRIGIKVEVAHPFMLIKHISNIKLGVLHR